jgi:hypothetical protein
MLSSVAHSVATVVEEIPKLQTRRMRIPCDFLGVLVFTIVGFLVMGYHPGLEDDGIYLAAVKADLNSSLFPFNSDFFRLQLQATVFDRFMAGFVRWTHIPVDWAELLWQLAALFLILWAVKKIANKLFAEESARWGGVATVAAMLTLPVTGTALYLADQHLHPRTLATAMILLAVRRVLDRKHGQTALLLLAAGLFHPLMTAMGVSYCIFLSVSTRDSGRLQIRCWRGASAAVLPLSWVFAPAQTGWRQALDTRTYYYLYKWTWYEWLGALAPLLFFGILWLRARKNGEILLAQFAAAVFCYGIFQQALAMALLWSPALIRVTPWQPMRYLHLLYFLLMLTTGGLLGRYLLKRSAWRWALFLLAANAGMLAWQRAEFAGSQHLELPGRAPTNQWLQAFAWVRQNTPVGAYFALDPSYMEMPGEDYHGFRALAERSQLADAVKDAAVVTLVPNLGPAWATQVNAEAGWRRFGPADFRRLKAQFGVNWVVVSYSQQVGLDCPWHDTSLAVCRIP